MATQGAEALELVARCAHCGELVPPEQRSPCPDCKALLHARCYVAAGGCTTPGCANSAGLMSSRAPGEIALWEIRRKQLTRVHTAITSAGILCGGIGVAGMGLSFLAMSAAWEGMIAGTFGFIAGAVLITAGLIVTSIAALRSPPGPIGSQLSTTPGLLYVTATALSWLSFAAGVTGMGMSLIVLAISTGAELIVGGGGFVAGALLVLGGAVGVSLLSMGAPLGPPPRLITGEAAPQPTR